MSMLMLKDQIFSISWLLVPPPMQAMRGQLGDQLSQLWGYCSNDILSLRKSALSSFKNHEQQREGQCKRSLSDSVKFEGEGILQKMRHRNNHLLSSRSKMENIDISANRLKRVSGLAILYQLLHWVLYLHCCSYFFLVNFTHGLLPGLPESPITPNFRIFSISQIVQQSGGLA